MTPADLNGFVAQARPHNQFRQGKIYFLISKRHLLELSPEEERLYRHVDGRRTVAELESLHQGARETLVKWQDAGIIELIPPIASAASPHLVVIEAHMDDGVLSAGGRLLKRRGQCRITLLTAVKWSNHTSYLHLHRPFLDVGEVTELRLNESALVARLLGAEHQCLDRNESPLRMWPGKRWSPAMIDRLNQVPRAFTGLYPDSREVSLLAEQMLHKIDALAPDELWIPMGLGDHFDHRTTRSACLLMLAEARHKFAGVPVVMYEDVPYASFIGHAAHIRTVLAAKGTHLVPCTEDITDVFDEKMRLVSVYASQFKPAFMEPKVRALAEREGGGGGRLAETYYRVEGEVRMPLESSLSREWAGLGALRRSLKSLASRATECRRLVVVALPSSHLGVWSANRDFLLAMFPRAAITLYAPEDMAWQTEEGGRDKLKIESVHGPWRGWVAAIWRQFFQFRTPVIVIWGGAYGIRLKSERGTFAGVAAWTTNLLVNAATKAVNLLIRIAFPFRTVAIAKSLGDFCGVLDELRQEDRRGMAQG